MKIDRGSLLAALTATSMLAAQVLVHRLVSLKLLNNYAFLVISLTMLGFGLSGVVLSRLMQRFQSASADWLTACSGLFGATLLGSASLLLRAKIDLADGGYGWVDVYNVTAEQQRPFDEVKADVVKAWNEAETARQLNEVAAKLPPGVY